MITIYGYRDGGRGPDTRLMDGRYIADSESWFSSNFLGDYYFLDDKIKSMMYRIDKVVHWGNRAFKRVSPTYYHYSLSMKKLSLSCKVAINVYIFPELIFNMAHLYLRAQEEILQSQNCKVVFPWDLRWESDYDKHVPIDALLITEYGKFHCDSMAELFLTMRYCETEWRNGPMTARQFLEEQEYGRKRRYNQVE